MEGVYKFGNTNMRRGSGRAEKKVKWTAVGEDIRVNTGEQSFSLDLEGYLDQSEVKGTRQILKLKRRLLDISCKNYRDSRFFPQESLKRLMSEEVIRGVLLEFLPRHKINNTIHDILDEGWKVFSILVLMERPSAMTALYDKLHGHSKLDLRLPFSLDSLHELFQVPLEVEWFNMYQWQFTIPTFSYSVSPYYFPRETILPFTEISSRFSLHPEHNHLHSSKTEFIKPAYHSKETFFNTLNILAALSPLKHPNLVELVTCFEHSSIYQLVFPLPSDGHLGDLLASHRSASVFRDDETMIKALGGLSSAIETLHCFTSGKKKLFGCHNCICPENILIDEGRFILSEFSFSQLEDSPTAFSSTPRSPPWSYYRAPENFIGQSLDIWSLGCVFAEVATYMILGSMGVKDFHRRSDLLANFYSYDGKEATPDLFHDWLTELKVRASQPCCILIQLVTEMLSFNPPTAAEITEKLQIMELCTAIQRIDSYYSALPSPLSVQRHEFEAWKLVIGSTSILQKQNWEWIDIKLRLDLDLTSSLEVISTISKSIHDGYTPSALELIDLNVQLFDLLPQDMRDQAEAQKQILISKNSSTAYFKGNIAARDADAGQEKLVRGSSGKMKDIEPSDGAIPETVPEQILTILKVDSILQPLYIEVLQSGNGAHRSGFEEKFVLLLQIYQDDLVSQIPDEKATRILRLIQEREKSFAEAVVRRFSVKQTQYVDWDSVFSHFPNELAETERYLANVNQKVQGFTTYDEKPVDKETRNLYSKKNEEQREMNEPNIYDNDRDVQFKVEQTVGNRGAHNSDPYPNYTRMKTFLFEGKAFANLRENVTQLVRDQLYTESETHEEKNHATQAPPEAYSQPAQVHIETPGEGSNTEGQEVTSDIMLVTSVSDRVSSTHSSISQNPEGPLFSLNAEVETLPAEGVVAQKQNNSVSSPKGWEPLVNESQMRRSSQSALEIHDNAELMSPTSERAPLLETPIFSEPREHKWGYIKTFFLYDFAKFLGLEIPLAQEKRRVRWKCCCGQKFYHDYSGDSDTPFNFAQDPATEAELAGRAWGDEHEPSSQTRVHDEIHQQASGQGNNQVPSQENIQNLQSEGGEKELEWIILCIPYWGIVKVVHLPSPKEKNDESLFNIIRKEYFNNRSWWSRFKNLKAVRKIHIAKFQLTRNNLAGMPEPGCWPCHELPMETVRKTWLYEPCPIRTNDKGEQESPIPSSWMLHLWNNPTHTAENKLEGQTNDQSNLLLALLAPVLKIFKLRNESAQADQEAHNSESDEEDFQDAPNHKVVFASTPKKLGRKLTIPRQFSQFPSGWGLYLEEGFKLSWLFMAILFIYLFASLAFGIAWAVVHESGPEGGLDPFGVSSWMVALLALSVTTWFAAVKD